MRKVLSIFMALIFAFAIAACGSNNGQSSSNSSTSSSAASAEQSQAKKGAPKVDPNATADQKNAVKKAYSYATTMHMSLNKIRDQLVQFDKFSEADADYAVSKLTDIDWNKVALKKAESYTQTVNMAKSKIP
ncbi:Ltp family lipoprotein, partial [Mitsuokella sp.]|uniref:Ltp family lipoprotein n=1 Tax=Mitsuokella sp. TaxID=2049034 RepID=UPI003D7C7CE2